MRPPLNTRTLAGHSTSGYIAGMGKNLHRFEISVPTDAGFIGRSCTSCRRYFKVHVDCLDRALSCAYCGASSSKEDLLTADQRRYVKQVGLEKAKEIAYGEIDRMMAGLGRQLRGQKHITFTHRPVNYRAKPIAPTYRERTVDSEIACPQCATRFQVYGIFGHCPGCASEQTLVYDANIEIIRAEVSGSGEPMRALRHAYGDLVSTFEAICKRHAKRLGIAGGRFQDLFDARKTFKDAVAIDMLESIPVGEVLTLRRVFQKRHSTGHAGGIIDDKYVRLIPEDRALLGQEAALSLDEFLEGARILRVVLLRLAPTR